MFFPVNQVIQPGQFAIAQKTVKKEDTAGGYGEASLEFLLATPSYVDLIIQASINVINPHLPEGLVSIGRTMQFTHDAPTSIGMTVTVKSIVTKVDGNHVYFEVIASDEAGEIGRGTHERVIISRDLLLQKANERLVGFRTE